MADLYLGFDPGGDRRFGVALLDHEHLSTSTVSTVADAISWAIGTCGSRRPIAAGIDTLLHWTTTKSGMRPGDLWLRGMYPADAKSVMAPNSLFGAMAIGGMALAIKLRQVWPEIELNETHPKMLVRALRNERYRPETIDSAIRWFVNCAHCPAWTPQGEDELDAALSAWATREGLADGWIDIVGQGGELIFPAGPVRYLWPRAISGIGGTKSAFSKDHQ